MVADSAFTYVRPVNLSWTGNLSRSFLLNRIFDGNSDMNMENIKKRIMIVDDNSLNREMLHEILSDTYDIIEAENGQVALDILEDGNMSDIDLIMLDLSMPVMDGFSCLKHIKNNEMLRFIPVIVVPQRSNRDNEIKALKMGAMDFISKPYIPEIVKHRVDNIIKLREDVAFAHQYRYDQLTGMYTCKYFFYEVRKCLDATPDIEYNLVASNIVNFNLYNELVRYKKSNKTIEKMADILNGAMGESEICGRFGIDRFVVFIERSKEEAIREKFMNMGHIDILRGQIVKWGIYEIDDKSLDIDIMCNRAFMAADSIKKTYNEDIAVYDDELKNKRLRENSITECMEDAICNEQFDIVYQPIYETDSGRMAGAEALVRWNNPKLGCIAPAEFIPIFEKNGFITNLDKYVVERVCNQLSKWKDGGLNLLPVSVNLSRADLYSKDITEYIVNCVHNYDLTVSDLCVEITESAYMDYPSYIINIVEKMRKSGLIVELDDFGSGYSSLNMLNEISVDILKMDMKFINSDTQRKAQHRIVQIIARLAKCMNLKIVAEGVETKEQLMQVRSVGCDYVQGYVFSKPLPADEFEKLLKGNHIIKRPWDNGEYKPAILVADVDVEYVKRVKSALEEDFEIISAVNCQDAEDCLNKKVSAAIIGVDLPGDKESLRKKLDQGEVRIPAISVLPFEAVADYPLDRILGDDYVCRKHPVSDLKKRIVDLISTVERT